MVPHKPAFEQNAVPPSPLHTQSAPPPPLLRQLVQPRYQYKVSFFTFFIQPVSQILSYTHQT